MGCCSYYPQHVPQLRCCLPRCPGSLSRSQVHERSVSSVSQEHGLEPHRQLSTRTPKPRWSGPTASLSIATRCAPTPTVVRTIGTAALSLPLAEFAINNAASSLDDGLTPALAAVRRQHRHSPMRYAGRMHEIDGQLFDSCWAAQAEQKAKLDAGRVDSVYTIVDRKLLRTKEASRCRRHW